MQWVLGSLLFCLAWPDGERYMSRACLHICFVYKLQWKRALTMDMLGTVHKWKPNVTDMIWRCLGTAIAMPNTMETRAQEPWSDYSWFFTDRASKSNQQNILKKDQTKAGHERGQNEVRTRYQTRSKTTRDRPLPKSWSWKIFGFS